jgi:hypothetical protein
VQNLPAVAGAGWTAETLNQVPSDTDQDGCAGFQFDLISYIPPSSFAGWTASCLTWLSDNAWNQTTSSQISFLTPGAAGGIISITFIPSFAPFESRLFFKFNSIGLTNDLVHNIAPQAGAGWTATNLAGVSTGSTVTGCAGFAPEHVSYFTPQAFNGWTSECVKWLASDAWSMTNADQIANLSVTGASGTHLLLISVFLINQTSSSHCCFSVVSRYLVFSFSRYLVISLSRFIFLSFYHFIVLSFYCFIGFSVSRFLNNIFRNQGKCNDEYSSSSSGRMDGK